MDNKIISKKFFIVCLMFSCVCSTIVLITTSINTKPHIVFCSVGQGDAIYIRTIDSNDILIDGGPRGGETLRCLSTYMPLYDRNIEYIFLSHPQIDHYGGLLDIVKRYGITFLIREPVDNNTISFRQLKNDIKAKNVKVRFSYQNDRITVGDMDIRFIWPSRDYISHYTRNNVPLVDLNNYSQIFKLRDGGLDVLFTGDIGPAIESSLLEEDISATILKVPHHGSKNGLTNGFIRRVNPQVSIISVGKNNTFGHPSPEILRLFQQLKRDYLRTDEKGDIVIYYDKERWWIP